MRGFLRWIGYSLRLIVAAFGWVVILMQEALIVLEGLKDHSHSRDPAGDPGPVPSRNRSCGCMRSKPRDQREHREGKGYELC